MSDFRLRVFSSVAKNLSFTKASQELFISQPAITKHIQELETMYQTRLFERMGNKILLTDAGRLLLEHCEKILEDYGRLEYEMNLLRNEHTGELRLGASTTIAQYVLPPLLARFIEKFPQVSLSLFSGNSSEVEKALQEHRIDLALVEGNTRQPNLKYTPFLQDELVAIVHTHSKWMDYDEITLDELKEVRKVISQPAITKHIQELETMYQTRLFERMGNKILLTDAGRLLLEHCEKILEDYGRLEYEMNLLRNEHTGELRLGASTTIAQYVLPPLLARFIEKFPQVSLSLFSGNSSEVEKALQEHRIDLALVEGNTRQPNLKYTPFLQDELVAIVHTRSKWMDYDEITLDELKEVPLVLRERGSGTLDVLITALHKHNIKLSDLTIRMHLGSTESIKLFLENSECMGILSIRSINKELYSGKFKVLDIKDLVMFREFDFVQLQGQDTGLPALFMQFANHYKEKL